MYEGKGQIVHDISGNGNHGRLGSSSSTDGRDADWVDGPARRRQRAALRRQRLHLDPRRHVAAPAAADRRGVGASATARPASASTSSPRAATAARPRPTGCTRRSTAASPSTSTTARSGTARRRAARRSGTAQWHHIAGTYDGKTVRLFVDGCEVGTGTPFSGQDQVRAALSARARSAPTAASCKLTLSGDGRRGADLARRRCRSAQIWGLINSRARAASPPRRCRRTRAQWSRGA